MSTPGGNNKSPEARNDEATAGGPPGSAAMSAKSVDDFEAERLKASADAELTLSEVKPIQTDFHFFVSDVRDKLKIEAEKEVRASITTAASDEELDRYLVNTNLNARLMKAWEDLSQQEREKYGKKEEVDRKRFMEEDEVASRHCATLTARVKSPAEPAAAGGGAGGGSGSEKSPTGSGEKEEKKDDGGDELQQEETQAANNTSAAASPLAKNIKEEGGGDDGDGGGGEELKESKAEEKAVATAGADDNDEDAAGSSDAAAVKRELGGTAPDDDEAHESPPKKTKADESGSVAAAAEV